MRFVEEAARSRQGRQATATIKETILFTRLRCIGAEFEVGR
jgi:hypothetical protein